MKIRKSKKVIIMSIMLSVFILSIIINVNFLSASSKYTVEFTDFSEKNKEFTKYGIHSSSSDYSDIGGPLNASEYGQGEFIDNDINITNSESTFIQVPEDWQANEITCNITEIYEEDKLWINDTFDTGYDSNYWNTYTDRPSYVSFSWHNDPTGPDDSLKIRFDSAGSSWTNIDSYWNWSIDLDRNQMPFTNWYVSFQFKAIYTTGAWLPGTGGAQLYARIDEDGSSTIFKQMKLTSIANDQWYSGAVSPFNPEIYDFNLPGTLSVCFGIDFGNSGIDPSGYLELYFDNITLEIPTIPKPSQINLSVNDLTNGNNYAISDISGEIGKGTVSINDIWAGLQGGSVHYFSFSSNSTGSVIIYSELFVNATSSKYTKTELNIIGSEFTAEHGQKNIWTAYFSVSIPGVYENEYYFNISKPWNWNVTHVYDPYGSDKISSLLATAGIGSDTLIIPNNIVLPGGTPINGRWKIVAESSNYVLDAKSWKYSSPNWDENASFQEGDLVKINATINTTLIPDIAQTNATMLVYHPNGTLWFQSNQVSIYAASGSFEFPNFTIGGRNTTIGSYSVHIRWNNLNSDQVGLFILTFEVFHSSSLEREINQAAIVEPIFTGDFVPIKVKYTDIDAEIGIYDAEVSYIVINATGSTISSGTFIYYGGGIYYTEISTVGWLNGDYNVTVAANKTYYQSQNRTNLIILRVTIATSLESSVISSTIPWNTNITIDIYYNRSDNGQGISSATINSNWDIGYWSKSEIVTGQYRMRFNTSIKALGAYQIVINATSAGYETKEINIFLTIRQRFTNISFTQPDAVNYRDNISILVKYGDADNNSWIPDGNIALSNKSSSEYWDSSIYAVSKVNSMTYNITFNSTIFGGVGTPYVYITAHKFNYANATTYINININDIGTKLNLFLNGTSFSEGQKKLLEVEDVLNITVTYKESQSNNHIENASVELSGRGNLNEDVGKEIYYKLINASSLGQGANIMTVIAQKPGFISKTIYFLLEITEKNTWIELYINNVNITDMTYIEHELTIGESVNISILYKDKDGTFIVNPTTAEIRGEGIIRNFTYYPSPEFYNVTIDSSELGFATNTFLIYFYKINYQQQSINVRIKVIDKPTDMSVYLNNEIRIDNGITLPYGATLNITVKFTYNESGIPTHLGNSLVILSGIILSNNTLTENGTYGIYTIIITTNQLDLGLSILSIVAEKANYETSSANLRIVIRTIQTQIKTVTGADEILATVGDTVILKIVINDTDYGQTIKGLQVKYSWAYGTGNLLDPDGDGVYEAVLANVPYGLYQISINVFNASDFYNFEPFRITISISYTTEQSTLIAIIQTLIVVSILGAIGFSSYIYAYQKVLKYPKPVRKVRKVKKGLKKKKLPHIDVEDRSNTLKNVFETEKINRAKFLKKVGKEDALDLEKKEITKKTIDSPIPETIEPPEAKSTEKTDVKIEEESSKTFIDEEKIDWIAPGEPGEKPPSEPLEKPEIEKRSTTEPLDKPIVKELPSVEPIEKPEVEKGDHPSPESSEPPEDKKNNSSLNDIKNNLDDE